MKQSLQHELRRLLPAWLFCVLLPLPSIILSQSDDGIPWRFSFFSAGCAGFVAFAFKHYACLQSPQQAWNRQMAIVGMGLFAAVVVFSTLCIMRNGPRDLIAVFKAIYISILAICIVPYFALVTRKFFTTVTFSILVVWWWSWFMDGMLPNMVIPRCLGRTPTCWSGYSGVSRFYFRLCSVF